MLANKFDRVYAHDPSQAQIDASAPHPKVEYRCAPAEASGLPDGSVDLAVAAQAAHWFDWPRYLDEVERVTRPGSLVALISYGVLHVDPGPEAKPRSLHSRGEADSILSRYYYDELGPYWPKGREHVENGYRDLALPWPAVIAPTVDMEVDWTREQLLGYVATWSATVKRMQECGPDAYEGLRERLAAVWPHDDERRTVTWPLAIRLARR